MDPRSRVDRARKWPVAVLPLLVALTTLAPPSRAVAASGEVPTPLQRVVDRLGEETRSFDGGALWGISVIDLDSGERADFQGDQWIKAASVLKPTWMAAAIRHSGLESVEPYAEAVMSWSNNEVSGRVIELAGGLDEVNSLTSGLGMNGTLVVEWTFGTVQRSKLYPGEHPYLNYTTTRDLVTFWRNLYQGWVLSPAETDALLGWSRLPKPAGAHSALINRLPDGATQWVSFKMGTLPPGRSYEVDENGEPIPVVEGARDTILGGGIVEVPGGPTYAVAVGGFGGPNWHGKIAFVEYASCRIHAVITGEGSDCDRAGDPARTRLDTDPPIGGLESVSGSPEFLTVRGWAVDPDDPLRAILVRFTVDGRWHGIIRAGARHSAGGDPIQVAPGHGFDTLLLVLLAPGGHEVCAHAINDGAGEDRLVGCQVVTIG